jgi:hypothetical protein
MINMLKLGWDAVLGAAIIVDEALRRVCEA